MVGMAAAAVLAEAGAVYGTWRWHGVANSTAAGSLAAPEGWDLLGVAGSGSLLSSCSHLKNP